MRREKHQEAEAERNRISHAKVVSVLAEVFADREKLQGRQSICDVELENLNQILLKKNRELIELDLSQKQIASNLEAAIKVADNCQLENLRLETQAEQDKVSYKYMVGKLEKAVKAAEYFQGETKRLEKQISSSQKKQEISEPIPEVISPAPLTPVSRTSNSSRVQQISKCKLSTDPIFIFYN
jgi:hypothetical protein